jgi:hypothetical protein
MATRYQVSLKGRHAGRGCNQKGSPGLSVRGGCCTRRHRTGPSRRWI